MAIDLATESHLTRDMVQARIAEIDPETADEDERRELELLSAFDAEADGYCADWKHGDAAIQEDYFLEHITQLIDDCYDMPHSSEWPYRHMTLDYEAAAEEAKQDYTCLELDGVTFYVR